MLGFDVFNMNRRSVRTLPIELAFSGNNDGVTEKNKINSNSTPPALALYQI